MTIKAQTDQPTFTDEAYPDGMLWRCEKCAYACDDDGPAACPKDGGQLSRVNRRITWGPLPSQKRDVVVEFR
jgi:hypothetical protein